jgi:hypothetical protein
LSNVATRIGRHRFRMQVLPSYTSERQSAEFPSLTIANSRQKQPFSNAEQRLGIQQNFYRGWLLTRTQRFPGIRRSQRMPRSRGFCGINRDFLRGENGAGCNCRNCGVHVGTPARVAGAVDFGVHPLVPARKNAGKQRESQLGRAKHEEWGRAGAFSERSQGEVIVR